MLFKRIGIQLPQTVLIFGAFSREWNGSESIWFFIDIFRDIGYTFGRRDQMRYVRVEKEFIVLLFFNKRPSTLVYFIATIIHLWKPKYVKFKYPAQRLDPMGEADFNLSTMPPARALYIYIR